MMHMKVGVDDDTEDWKQRRGALPVSVSLSLCLSLFISIASCECVRV